GAGHGAGGVLAVGDGDDARAAHQAHGGLQAHEAADGGGADDGSIGLGADGGGAEVGGGGGGGSGARSAGGAGEGVGGAGEAGGGAPAAGGARGADVGPLAEVGFAEQDGARGAQARGDVGVAGRGRAVERERARGGLRAIAGVDVVLEEDRDAVQRP